jgi:hypothetical protein
LPVELAGSIADAKIADLAATKLTGTIADARLPTVPVTKGGTGITSLGSANQQLRVNSGANALEFATISGGRTLQSPTKIVHDSSQNSFSQSGTDMGGQGVFYYPSSALLSGTFAKTSATSTLAIIVMYNCENNGTNQHDTYLWAGNASVLGTAGDNFRLKVGDDSNRAWAGYQYTKGTFFVTGMSVATHTINFANGTYPNRTHTGYYCSEQQHGDRSSGGNHSYIWCYEIEA